MLNQMESWYVRNGYFPNAISKFFDRMTENGQFPERMTLAQAKAVVNDYMLECGYSRDQLRK